MRRHLTSLTVLRSTHKTGRASYAIDDPSVVTLSDDVAALIYTGTGHRDGDDFTGIMSSVYVRRDSGRKLAHFQQTAKP